jgi:hypothetical protein
MGFDASRRFDDERVLHLHPVKVKHTSIELNNLY